MRKVAACFGGAVALGVYVRWVRPRVFSWGATGEEASRPMAGDELCPRPITRLRSRYAWIKPTIVTELILMEIGDPFMMRKCLLGIKQRAEQLAAERRRERAVRPAGRQQSAASAHR